MSVYWYEDYFGEGTKQTLAHIDPEGRLFVSDIKGGLCVTDDHNCDAMGCGSVGPHIHSVYINADKYNQLQANYEELISIIQRYYNHCGNNMQICGLNWEAKQALKEKP